ncbi:MAG: hypothetical protein P0S93_00830 [Candidatus Neptunochlamydia sp.]|nr:hypothetical protein [Candidatus Neptunochlamydia sp.]
MEESVEEVNCTEDCNQVREEYNDPKGKHKTVLTQLEETVIKIYDLIMDKLNDAWNKYYELLIYKGWMHLDDENWASDFPYFAL